MKPVRTPIAEERDSLINNKILRSLESWVLERKFCEDYDDLDAIARDLDISAQQLGFFCTSVIGERFFSWRKGLRMRYAALLLSLDNEIPTSSVGRMVGVSDKSDFRRQFMEYFKVTPEQWRQQF